MDWCNKVNVDVKVDVSFVRRSNRTGKCIVLRWSRSPISWAEFTGAWRSFTPRKIPRIRDAYRVVAACTQWCTRIRHRTAVPRRRHPLRRHPRRSHAPNLSRRSAHRALSASASSPGRFCGGTTRCTAHRHVPSHRRISTRRTTPFPIMSFIANPSRRKWIRTRYRRKSCLKRRLGACERFQKNPALFAN